MVHSRIVAANGALLLLLLAVAAPSGVAAQEGLPRPERAPVRDLVTRRTAGICVSCTADFVGYLADAAPDAVPVHERARSEERPCIFCGRSRLGSALRFRRGSGVICALCVASATRLFERPRGVGVRNVPRGLAAELRRGRRAFLRRFPELRLIFATRRRPPRDQAS